MTARLRSNRPPHWVAPALVLSGGTLTLHALPSVEITVFAQMAARVAGLLAGSPVGAVDGGWTLVLAQQPVVVTQACSAAGFFVSVASLLAWQLARRGRSCLAAALFAVALALPVTAGVNALRIVSLAQVHHWIIPLLPEAWSAFVHMTTGVAVFLPALISLHALVERHGRIRSADTR